MNRHSIFFIFLAFCTPAIGSDKEKAEQAPFIHPLIFQMVDCWTSDTSYPVVTEFNLDAIEKNRNQFDRDDVKKVGEWTEFRNMSDSGEALLRCKISQPKDGIFTAIFTENGEGSMTTVRFIRFSIGERIFGVDGKQISHRTLKILSISNHE